MPDQHFSYGDAFNVKLEQLDGQDKGSQPKVIGSILITFDTLQKVSQQERVLVWGLPLAALQKKM